MNETPESRADNPYKDRPFFRRVLWRLFGEGGMFNTLPNSEGAANRLLLKVEEALNTRSLSRDSLRYLQMVHLHLIGDGMDNLLRAQEKTNKLLGKLVEQQANIGEQLEDILQRMDSGDLPVAEGTDEPQPAAPGQAELPDEDTEEQDGGGE